MTFQELGILIIFDPQGKNGDSSDKNHSPQPLAYPRPKARVRLPSLRRRGVVPIFGDGFIHVCGHPRLQRRLLWWRHCHQLTAKKCPFKCEQIICPGGVYQSRLFHPVVTHTTLAFYCADPPTSTVEPLAAVQLRQKAKNTQESAGHVVVGIPKLK